jgi:hypothetical protein
MPLWVGLPHEARVSTAAAVLDRAEVQGMRRHDRPLVSGVDSAVRGDGIDAGSTAETSDLPRLDLEDLDEEPRRAVLADHHDRDRAFEAAGGFSTTRCSSRPPKSRSSDRRSGDRSWRAALDPLTFDRSAEARLAPLRAAASGRRYGPIVHGS